MTQFHIKSNGEIFFKGMVVGNDARIAEKIQNFIETLKQKEHRASWMLSQLSVKDRTRLEVAWGKHLEEQIPSQE